MHSGYCIDNHSPLLESYTTIYPRSRSGNLFLRSATIDDLAGVGNLQS